MTRVTLYFTKQQIYKMSRVKDTEGTSVAETVRRAVDQYLKEKQA